MVRRSVVVMALLLAGLGSEARADGKDKAVKAADEVRAVEAARGKALLAGDTAEIARQTADDFVEISRLGMLRTKADNLRDLTSGALKITSFKQDSVSVRVYGDVAILREITDNTGSMRGFPFAGRIWVTRMYVKRDGRWQAVAMQHTPIP
ncbi:MAG: nuclear transport factor 2 family protein [Candidatus Eisenbacteria bacterium]|uniref:Nuclear transport factor 2 family protein n=1 Tax=Eiseniibacteriota bacterium TaxID=2212470 RepID=A0A538TVW9_UNCEI|nr:MAG: nuclear transport factor 2 family protein [Candidatus Eisenbacteria bacterium]